MWNIFIGQEPIGSMYAIYGNIYHQYTPVLLPYIPYMDLMGKHKTIEKPSSSISIWFRKWAQSRPDFP